MTGRALTPQAIERAIRFLRGHRVILDVDIAKLYGVTTGRLNEAVKRNVTRFPQDFMFRLTPEEAANLRSQFAISSSGKSSHGGRRNNPLAFTEQGVAMLASILNSPRAIAVNIEIVRVFVRIRHVIAINADVARRIDALERQIADRVTGSDEKFKVVFQVLRKLMDDNTTTGTKPAPIGFQVHNKK